MSTKLLLKLGVENEADGLAAIDASTAFINAVKSGTDASDFAGVINRLGDLAAYSQIEEIAGAKGDELVGKIAALKDDAARLPEAIAKLEAIGAKAEADKAESDAKRLTSLVDDALKSGAVPKARADWLREQPLATVESFLAVSSDGLPGTQMPDPEQPPAGVTLSAEDRQVANQLGIPEDDFLAAKKEA
jgi:phage I-like protein